MPNHEDLRHGAATALGSVYGALSTACDAVPLWVGACRSGARVPDSRCTVPRRFPCRPMYRTIVLWVENVRYVSE